MNAERSQMLTFAKPVNKCRECGKKINFSNIKYCSTSCRLKHNKNTNKVPVLNPSGRTVMVGLKKAKERAWKSFSTYIRVRDCIKTTGNVFYCICITCKHTVPFYSSSGNFIQSGHAISSRCNSILFDEELVNGQCQQCNVFKSGNYHIYEEEMIKLNGQEWWDEKMKLKHQTRKYSIQDFIDIETKYKNKLLII
jgi:hypothetical protein